MQLRVFISYSREDGREYADALYHALRAEGIGAWRDERSLNPYADASAELERAIREATHMIVCVTPSLEHNPESYVRREIAYAQQKRKPILPLVFEGAAVPVLISHLLWLEISDPRAGFAAVVGRLRAAVPVAPPERDPCRPYLTALLEQIVTFLERTTFTLVPLRSRGEPGAVPRPVTHAPVKIVSLALPVRSGEPEALAATEAEEFEDFGAVLERYGGSVLLLGEPGAGKSTTLWTAAREAVVRRLADPAQPLPIVAQIPSWDPARHPTLEAWLCDAVSGLPREQLEHALRAGRAALFLDALDELGTQRRGPAGGTFDPRSRFIQFLPADLPQVVTCRRGDYERIGQQAPLHGAVVLEPLQDEQIALYLHDQPEVWEVLRHDAGLRDALRTPLLLSVFTYAVAGLGSAASELRGMQPGELRERVFDLFVERRYGHEALKPNANLPFTLPEFRAILEELAYDTVQLQVMADGPVPGDGEVTLNDIRDTIVLRSHPWLLTSKWGRRLLLPADLLGVGQSRARRFAELAARLHLLLHAGPLRFRYLHLVLRDTFAMRAARAVTGKPWELQRAREVLAKLGGPGTIRTLVREGGTPPHPAQADASVVPQLLVDLQGPRTATRENAARRLGQLGDPRAVEPLIERLDDFHYGMRDVVATALGEIGDLRALVPLVRLLNRGPRRESVIRALGQLGAEEVAPVLIGCLFDPRCEVRTAAAEALGTLRSTIAVAPLMEQLRERHRFRRSVAMAVARRVLGTDFSLFPGGYDLFDWRRENLYETAAEVLGRLGDAKAAPALVEAASDRAPWLRKAAVRALGDLGAREGTAGLVRALDDTLIAVRFEAAFALGRLNDERAVEPLAERLGETELLSLRLERTRASWLRVSYSFTVTSVGEAAAVALMMIGTSAAREAAMRSPHAQNWPRSYPPLWVTDRLGEAAPGHEPPT